jgi:hypothetical protein
VAPAIAALVAVALAAIVLARRPRSRAARTFAAFAASLALWNFAVYRFRVAADAETAQRWQLAVYVALFVAPALYYRLVHVIVGVPERRASGLVYASTLGALLAAALRFDLFVRGVTPTAEGWAPVSGPLAAVWFLVALAITAATFRPLILARRQTEAPRPARPVVLLLLATAIRLLGPLVSFAGVLLLRAGVLKAALPPVVVGAMVLVGCLAAVATLDSES